MAWILVLIAGLFEVGWAVGMKSSEGFTRLVPSFLTVVALTASFGCLTLSLRWLPLGTAYAVWTGIGAAGTAAVGMYLFHEPVTALRIVSIACVVAGIVGLKIAG
jgi:quaternary ammonium compound-resistance protein SugE